MRGFSVLIFVVLTFCCWGVYGPVLHIGQEIMGDGPGKLSSLRPFICVGVAYFLVAVVYPLATLKSVGEKGSWSASGFVWSFIAGAVGAVGALGIIMAFKFQGKPVYVMPLVFGLAPIVNTFVTMLMAGTIKQASAKFYLGILIVAVGAAGVLTFKPTKAKPAAPADPAPEVSQVEQVPLRLVRWEQEQEQEETQTPPTESSPGELKATEQTGSPPQEGNAATVGNGPANPKLLNAQVQVDSEADPLGQPAEPAVAADRFDPDNPPVPAEEGAAPAEPQPLAQPDTESRPEPNLWLIGLSIAVTALCWGAYGPVLHKGQAKMAGSRLRPFLCVGLAYFAIAVIVPLGLQGQFEEPGGWNLPGTLWSMLAGVAGAVGALGIIYAFNFGGKPIYVMPLVFGFAPVVNTLTETLSKNLLSEVSVYFLGSLVMVIVGAVMVLVFAPRGPKPAPASE